MKPPFTGAKTLIDMDLEKVFRLIDTHMLFVGQWQFKRTKESETAYQKLLKNKAWPAFEEWKKRCIDEKILEPKIAYGYFKSAEVLKCLSVEVEKLKRPQQQTSTLLHSYTPTLVPLQIVTVGSKVAEKCQWLFASHKYTDYLYLHGLAVATAEALAEYSHRNILNELGVEFNLNKKLPAMSRVSPGYPVWPNLKDQRELHKLLDAEKIGVSITETYQLVPEYSTSAMIIL